MRGKSLRLILVFSLIFILATSLSLLGQVLKFKGPSQPPSKIIEVPDDQMNEFLNRLDVRFEGKYADLINKIRQAWNSRHIPQYDSLVSALILKIKNDVFGDQGLQPTGGCEQYLGWHHCYCGPSVTCCCPFPCNSVLLNLCIGVDMGGIIGGGGGGGGGGGMYYICRPIGFTKR